MIRETVNALLACVVTFAVCAVAYPAAVYGLGHTLFPRQAEGSLIERDGRVVGSELIAQPFASEAYFQPRPSAAGSAGYSADAASGSNLGTKNPALRERIVLDVARQLVAHDGNDNLKARIDRLDALQADLKAKNEAKEKSDADTAAIAKVEEEASSVKAEILAQVLALKASAKDLVPVDLVTASGGGLDPHISAEAAAYQAPRVAAARGADARKVSDLVGRHTERSGEIIGAPARVNVLLLNLDLDQELPAKAGGPAPKPEPAPTASGAANPPAATPSPSTPAPTAEARPATEARPEPAAAAAGPRPGPAPAADPPRADAAVAGIAGRLDALEAKVDATPIAGLSTELAGLKARVAAIDDRTKAGTAQGRAIADLEARVTALDRDARSVRDELNAARSPAGGDQAVAAVDRRVAAVKAEVDSLRDAFRGIEKAATATAPAAKEPRREPDLGPALALFRDKKYAAASEAFRALTGSFPEDARAWYYAAIANGLATGQWRGETEAMVGRGVEREKAGTPHAAAIDASVAALDKASGGEWLAFYRRRARP